MSKTVHLYEAQVVAGVCGFLRGEGFRITQQLATTDHGEEIRAVAPGGNQVTIEAKGATSSRSGSSRYGKPFDSGHVRDHVSKAVYCAATYVSSRTLWGVAFSKNDAHVQCVGKILPALKKLKIEVFWVGSDKKVEIARHWDIWK